MKRPIPICKNASTQTNNIICSDASINTDSENSYCEVHIIANVHQSSPVLPLIIVNIAYFESKVLFDTGSSVSIISKTYFNHIKPSLKVKYLSRQFKILTINSSIWFSSCVSFSFKIQRKNFNHIFYVINMTEESTFSIILGYDFIHKLKIQLDPEYKFCNINNLKIPFVNCDSNALNKFRVIV